MKPGQAFEQSLLASLPRRRNSETGKLETDPLIFHRKSPTPPRPAPVRELVNETRMLRAAVEGAEKKILGAIVDEGTRRHFAGEADLPVAPWAAVLDPLRAALAALTAEPEWIAQADKYGSSFTPGAGVDITITAPAASWKVHQSEGEGGPPVHGVYDDGGKYVLRPGRPVIHFSIEAKSVAGKSLPFDALREEQARILRQGRAACHVAGIAIEFREVGECWFILIDRWDEAVLAGKRKSLSLADARKIGVRIEEDEERGKTAVYWRMGEFLQHFGAEV